MFSAFKKIKKDRSLNKNGCGLGLTLSKKLAIALGGNITVESEIGKGSTFTLILKSFDPLDNLHINYTS